jgi:hypothetical protein
MQLFASLIVPFAAFFLIFALSIVFQVPDLVYAVLVLMGKIGLCLAFGILFVIHSELFPIQFISSSYGITNIFSRSAGLMGPMVAEV